MNNEIVFYSTPDGDKKIEVVFQDENFWLTQKALAGLFDVKVPAVSKHLKNIFDSGELTEKSVVSILETTAADGKAYKTRYYNLDAIIAVGYRVNSYQATQFRIWATKTLKEFIIKGFVLDDERLKQGSHFGKDYFDELLERIREIRASVPVNTPEFELNERQQWFYQQLVAGRDVKAGDIAALWNVTEKTAKRDIATLRGKRLIEFVGAPKTGRYQLKVSL